MPIPDVPNTELYADILLPLARGVFTYRVGECICDRAAEGMCVEVQLGANKLYTGVIWRLHNDRPPYGRVKTVDSFVENSPVITPLQRRFWEWLAGYYMCNPGDVMRAALPSALKPSGFSHEEFAREAYKPIFEKYVRLHPSITGEQQLHAGCEALRRAKRQYEAVVGFLSFAGEDRAFDAEIPVRQLKISAAILKKLEAKEVFITVLRQKEQPDSAYPARPLPLLTPAQQRAYEEIVAGFAQKEVALLHGVTGSGKTEIYTHLIKEQLDAGRNVLYLLPEISMSAQTVERIMGFFGDCVVPYHSSYSPRVRVDNYMRANRSRGGDLILGTRSAVFLPASDLGLVIIDEEHDESFKNNDTAPRYHARDAAIVLARMSGARVVLGSATPSVESYSNAIGGKYTLVTLTERYGGVPMPRIVVSDTRRAVERGERTVHFNKELLDRMHAAITGGGQVMLFQNRRGFSPYVECGACGWVAMCPDCNVALTYHKADDSLKCHYCGHRIRKPGQCPGCGVGQVEPRGFGTEKVEDELSRLFPGVRIARLDRDTAGSMRRYSEIISSFARGEADILVGTKMITKGLDFEGVSLVGILNADNLLFYPDFRASERAFQIMTQMAGRAGRRTEQGTVIIQTSQPDNQTIRQVAAGDYAAMVRTQLAERSAFFYPPYCRLISIVLKHRDKVKLDITASALSAALRPVFGNRLIGPQPPPVDRIKGEFLQTFLLKVERTESFERAKKILSEAVRGLRGHSVSRTVTVICNVDPQ